MYQVNSEFGETVLPYLASILLCYLLYKFIVSKTTTNRKETKQVSDADKYNFCTNPTCLRCNSDVPRSVHSKNDFRSLPRLRKWSECTDPTFGNEKQKPTVFYLPDLDTFSTIQSNLYKEDVAILESNFDVIKKEMDDLLRHETESGGKGWKINSTPSGKWRVFYLFNQGYEVSITLVDAFCLVLISAFWKVACFFLQLR